MHSDSHPILAREGWWHIGVALLAVVLATAWAGLWALPVWLVAVFVLQFFRDPHRAIPAAANAVVAPADGKVVAVIDCQDPYLDRAARKISVFMNVFSVHSNRAPIAGTIRRVWYTPGKFFNAALDKASSDNERNALWIRDVSGHDVVCVQIAGLVARRILCHVDAGDTLARGQRYGFIRFGSRVDVYLPREASLSVRLGDWVSAGSDIIAALPGNKA